MKAYNKSEVDIVFSGWEEDLKQLSEIEVVSVDVLNKIRAEIDSIELSGHVDDYTMFVRTAEQVKNMGLDIIDKYREGEQK